MAELSPKQKRYIRRQAGRLKTAQIARKLGVSEKAVRDFQDSQTAAESALAKLGRWAPAVVAVVAFLAFANTMPGGFPFDDSPLIENNPSIRDAGSIPRLFQQNYWYPHNKEGMLYRPLVTTSFALNYLAGRSSPAGYHLVNVLLHAAVCALMFLLLRVRYGNDRVAWAASLLFALHPIHTESVASIVGRAELLAALAVLGAWLLSRAPAEPGGRVGLLRGVAASVVLFLGLLSKESALILPVILFLDDITRPEAAGTPLKNRVRSSVRPVYLGFAAAIASYLLIRYLALGVLVGKDDTADWDLDNPLHTLPFFPRVLTVVKVLSIYIRLMFWPVGLSPDYSFNQITLVNSPFSVGFLVPLGVLAAFITLAMIRFGKKRVFLFPVAFFFLAILPASNLLTVIGTILGERLVYLPSFGFCLAAALAYDRFVAKDQDGKWPMVVGLIVLIAAGVLTVKRNPVWKNNLTLFRDAVAVCPNSAKAHAMLAESLLVRKQPGSAIPELQEAIRIYPDYADAHQNIGWAYFETAQKMESSGSREAAQERYRKALEEFKTADRLRPDSPAHVYAVGNAYLVLGQEANAMSYLTKAIRLKDGGHVEALVSRGYIYYRRNELKLAKADFEAALRQQPGHQKASQNLAAVNRRLRNEERLQDLEQGAEAPRN